MKQAVDGRTSRRKILQLFVLAGAGVFGPAACRRTATTAEWIDVHAEAESAAQIGALWIHSQRTPASTDDLLAMLAAPRDVAALNEEGIKAIRGHLLEKHRADFAAARVTRVAGWLLSATEATLYGLMARLTGQA